MNPYYRNARVTLYHGDCREILPTLGVVDHIITDPPYDEQTHAGAMTETSTDVRRININFAPLDVAQMAPFLVSYAWRWVIAFCALEMLGDYKRAVGEAWVRAGFWRRVGTTPQFTGDRPGQPGEGIAIMHRSLEMSRMGMMRWHGRGKSAFYEARTPRGDDRVHPTQKPESLMAALIKDFTDDNDLICDPFAGSGTTLVEAARLGRRAIGMEINEQYCESCAKRLALADRQQSLFEESV